MKNILILFLMLISLSGMAQKPVKPAKTVNDAGNELLKHSRHYYVGTGLALGGFFTLTTTPMIKNMEMETRLKVYTLGGVMLITGAIILIESHSHIGKAGRILKNLDVKSNGLTYNF